MTPIWPPNGLRDRLVARGRKRLCTTGLGPANLAQDESNSKTSVVLALYGTV